MTPYSPESRSPEDVAALDRHERSAIRPVDIRLWLADELKAGIAPSSVHRHFRVLRRVLNAAVASELLQRSPCTASRRRRCRRRFLTSAEVCRLAEAITPAFRALVYTAAYSGLRWGEPTGLRRARFAVDRDGVRR